MIRALLIICASLFLLAAAAALGAWLWLRAQLDAPGPMPTDVDPAGPVLFKVERGATGKGVGNALAKEGLLEHQFVWRYLLWSEGGLSVKAGRFELARGMSPRELLRALSNPPLPEDEPIALIEGWRLRDSDALLAQQGWCAPGAYLEAALNPGRFKASFPLPAASLEGYLYPETYRMVREGFEIRNLIQRQLDTFGMRFALPYAEEIARSGRTLHELVTMASMLEREEPTPANRPLVAGILWKRLAKGMALGVDATSRYELAEWNDRRAFLVQLRDPKSLWNTRLRKGLPPGPIGAPALESLLAALRPIESDYWFYLHDATGALHPSRNGQEHEALRRMHNVY